LTFCDTTYTAEQLETFLLTTPSEGECTTALLHQFITAKLNIANGASEEYVNLTAESLAGAEAFLCGGEADCISLTNTLDSERAQFECPVRE
jgi:ABC-type transporter Mla subunit MlaD